MATLGQKPATQHVSTEKQTLTGNGGTSYTLQQSVSQASDIEVFVNNTRQEPTVAYTANNTTLTMTGAVNSSDSFYVIFQGKAIQTAGLPVDAAITASAITASTIAVSQKLNIGGTTTPPSSPSAGDLWFNSATSTVSSVSSKALSVYNGTAWNQVSNLFSASGGTESSYSSGGTSYRAHTFTSSGTFTPSGDKVVQVLVVAGGGGSAYSQYHNGGAGAGGVVIHTGLNVTAGDEITVTVGAGGTGGTSTGADGTAGGNSVFGAITANGGGKGSGYNADPGGAGGSGGGGAENGQTSSHVAGSSNQGNSGGGTGYGNDGGTGGLTANVSAGGGGGAGAAGGQGNGTVGGAGGVGIQNDYQTGSNQYYAGGGGGACYNNTAAATSAGGAGGGGPGFTRGSNGAAGSANGTVNTGGGAGGYERADLRHGGIGGSGIVIVRYTV